MPWPLILILGLVLVGGLLLGALVLRTVCGLFGEEQPSYKRALLMLPLITIPVMLCFEVIGYGVAKAMHESFQIPPGFSFLNWIRLPIGIQWEVLSKLPLLKYVAIIIPLCLAGFLMVAWLNCNFRIGLGIFLVQWVINFLSLAFISEIGFMLLHVVQGTIGLPEDVVAYLSPQSAIPGHVVAQTNQRTGSQPAEVENQASAPPPPTGGRFSTLKTALTGAAALAGHDGSGEKTDLSKTGSESAEKPGDTNPVNQFLNQDNHQVMQSWGHSMAEALDHLRHGAEPLVESVSKSAEPITKYLPEPIHHFLDNGGWWIIIGIAFVVSLLYLRHLVGRIRHLMKPKKRKASDNWHKELSFALGTMGEPLHPVGPVQATVQGVPARLRFVALAAGGKEVEPISENSLESVLEQILGGLYGAVSQDEPFVKVWETAYGGTLGFAAQFHNLVKIPGQANKPSKWVLIAGTVKFGPTEKIHLGLAFQTAKPTTLRNITVRNGNWLEVLGTKNNA